MNTQHDVSNVTSMEKMFNFVQNLKAKYQLGRIVCIKFQIHVCEHNFYL